MRTKAHQRVYLLVEVVELLVGEGDWPDYFHSFVLEMLREGGLGGLWGCGRRL
jgi:hypothetical protein